MIREVPVVGPDRALTIMLEHLDGRTGTCWVGIDGRGGSGKTAFAERVRRLIPDTVVIHVDDFFRAGVDGWDRDGFTTEVVGPVMAGRTGRYRRWNWATQREGAWLEVAPGGVLVVEGVSATDCRLDIGWELTVWVDTPAEVRWRRVMERDGEAWRDTWLNVWIPSEDAYVREQRPQDRVDLIVDTTR